LGTVLTTNPPFGLDFKNINLPSQQNAPKKVIPENPNFSKQEIGFSGKTIFYSHFVTQIHPQICLQGVPYYCGLFSWSRANR
jgi:hypothetical protein